MTTFADRTINLRRVTRGSATWAILQYQNQATGCRQFKALSFGDLRPVCPRPVIR